jgi:hypothetical protein
MSHFPLRYLLAAFLVTLLAMFLIGCASRPQSAQKLYDKGEYQAVIDKYPDLEIARRAHAKLGDELLKTGDFRGVISKFADTPAAYKAQTELAQKMFDQGQYQALIDSFPHSTLVNPAKERLSDAMFQRGALDSIVMLYPDTPHGKEIKNQQANEALSAAKKLRGQARVDALQSFIGRFAGTDAYKEGSELFTKAREEQNRKNPGH